MDGRELGQVEGGSKDRSRARRGVLAGGRRWGEVAPERRGALLPKLPACPNPTAWGDDWVNAEVHQGAMSSLSLGLECGHWGLVVHALRVLEVMARVRPAAVWSTRPIRIIHQVLSQ
jgi:hypothetical protein